MADSTIIPAELDISDLSSEETLENLQKAGLEVFEVAGAIKWFDASKGYGFIVPDNGLGDILLHVTCLRAGGYQTAYEGARIHCQVMKRPKGLQAFSTMCPTTTTGQTG